MTTTPTIQDHVTARPRTVEQVLAARGAAWDPRNRRRSSYSVSETRGGDVRGVVLHSATYRSTCFLRPGTESFDLFANLSSGFTRQPGDWVDSVVRWFFPNN